MDTEAFLKQYFPTATDEAVTRITNWLKFTEEQLGEPITADALKSKDKRFYSTLFTGETSTVSNSKYFMIKGWLTNLLSYVGVENISIPNREEALDLVANKGYFKSLQELIDYIDYCGKAKIPNVNPSINMLYLKSICILGWYGFSLEQMADVLNSDLVVFEGDYCVKKDGMLISLKSEEYNILKTLSMTDTHQGYPSGRIVYYKNSKYLFRVRDTGAANTEEKVNIDSLKLAIKKFNNNNPQKIDISLRKLRKNKLFIDIYNDKKDLPLYDKIMTYFNSSKDLTWLLKKEYTSWLKNVMEI
jgi:hypothetical protein